MQGSLSSQIVVGFESGIVILQELNECKDNFEVENAAKNSASVELKTVIYYVFNLYTTAQPDRVIEKSVVEQYIWGSLAYSASM